MRARERHSSAEQGAAVDACHGFKMRYINPATGGHAMPTIATFMQLLPRASAAGAIAAPMRRYSWALKAGVALASVIRRSSGDRGTFVVPAGPRTQRRDVGAVQLLRPRRAGTARSVARSARLNTAPAMVGEFPADRILPRCQTSGSAWGATRRQRTRGMRHLFARPRVVSAYPWCGLEPGSHHRSADWSRRWWERACGGAPALEIAASAFGGRTVAAYELDGSERAVS